MGSEEAGQHPQFSFHHETQVMVVAHGHGFTFAGTESDLRKIVKTAEDGTFRKLKSWAELSDGARSRVRFEGPKSTGIVVN